MFSGTPESVAVPDVVQLIWFVFKTKAARLGRGAHLPPGFK